MPRISRRSVLQRTLTATGGALVAGPAFLRLSPPWVAAAASTADNLTLAGLVTMEDAAVFVYARLAATLAPPSPATGQTPGPGPLKIGASVLAAQHSVHRDTLVQALTRLGGTVPPLDADHSGLLPTGSTAQAALDALDRVESGIVGGQYAALGSLSDRTLVSLVASLYGVAARRQAIVAHAAGRGELHGPVVTGDAQAAQAILAGKLP
jgi:hypothetical protein